MILWAGGEDIDFPNSASGVTVNTTAGHFRSGYAREAVLSASTTNPARSLAFPGGAVTSCWYSIQAYVTGAGTSTLWCGLVKDGSSSSGLYLGTGTSSATKLTLYKYDGTTKTALASESGTSLPAGATLTRFDMQLISFGASATVNVYMNGILLITFSGDTTVTGVTSLSAAVIGPITATGGIFQGSEIIVADEDTRPFLGLLTMAPTATGTTNQWANNAASNVNPAAINDANATSTNTVPQDQQYNVTDLPAGNFAAKAVRVAARAWITSGATATKIQLGVNSGGTVAASAAQAVSTGATTYENLYATNPATGSAWAIAEINPLQINLRSST